MTRAFIKLDLPGPWRVVPEYLHVQDFRLYLDLTTKPSRTLTADIGGRLAIGSVMLSARARRGNILNMNWEPVASAEGYQVQVIDDTGATVIQSQFIPVVGTTASVSEDVLTRVRGGKLRVCAFVGSVVGPFSGVVSIPSAAGGTALHLPTASSSMVIPSNDAYSLANGDFTFALRIKGTVGGCLLTRMAPDGDNAGFAISVEDGKITVETKSAATFQSLFIETVQLSILDQNWHHVAVVRRKTGRDCHIEVYADGKHCRTDQEGAVDMIDVAVVSPLRVGASSAGNGGWVGMVRDIRVWSKALDAVTIANMAAKPAAAYQDGLIGSWPLTTGSPNDESSNASHGVLMNGARIDTEGG